MLVADPANLCLLAALEEDAVLALQVLDGLRKALEVVILGVRAGTLGAVHPDLDELAVISILLVAQDLAELAVVEVVVVVLVAILVPVGGLVDVPGGEVQAHVHALLGAGAGKLGEDVDLAGGAAHVVVGGRAVPDAEAVVVLGGDDQAGEASLLDHLDVAVGIEGLEPVHIFGSGGHLGAIGFGGAVVFAPLLAGEGVRTEVAERGEFFLRVLVLAASGLDVVLLRLGTRGAGEAVVRHPGFSERRCGQGDRAAEGSHDGEPHEVAMLHFPPIVCCRKRRQVRVRIRWIEMTVGALNKTIVCAQGHRVRSEVRRTPIFRTRTVGSFSLRCIA